MDYVKLSQNIATVAAVAVPVLQNVLSAEQVIAGLVSQLTQQQLPVKPDGAPYTQQDVAEAALAAHAAWHSAD